MNEHARRRTWRRCAVAPALEHLEGRRLLSAYAGPSFNQVVQSTGGRFLISVSGPGVLKVHSAGRAGVDVSAFGTTNASTITVTQIRPPWHSPSRYVVLNKVTVTSHQLGGLDASACELNGAMTPLAGTTVSAPTGSTSSSSSAPVPLVPLNNTLNTLELGSIGPNAEIDVNGNVGSMTVSQVDLGPTGHVDISGELNTNNLTGSMTIGGFTIDGGRFVIGEDSMAAIGVAGNMTISHNGVFSVGRDLDGGLSVSGNLELDSGGQIFVGRNLSSLAVDGNLIVNPTGSGIVVNGELGSLSVEGIFQGQGGTAAPEYYDLGVGLGLTDLTISGANLSLDSLINANIRAGGSIANVDIAYNSVNSMIQPNTPP